MKSANCNDYLSPSQYHSYLGLFLTFFFQISVVDEKREETITRINSKLPSCIKVQSIKKVTKNFNCKSACDSRTYLYLLPTFALAPILPLNELKPIILTNCRHSPIWNCQFCKAKCCSKQNRVEIFKLVEKVQKFTKFSFLN